MGVSEGGHDATQCKYGGCPYHPPTVSPVPPDSRPSYRQSPVCLSACIYTLLRTNELFILLCCLVCSSLTGTLNVLLEHSVCSPVTMQLGWFYICACSNINVTLFCSFYFLVAHGPFSPLMINPGCCHLPPVQRSPAFIFHVIYFASLLLSLIDITLQVVVCFMAEVMLEVDDLKGRSVLELAANSWKHITYRSAC